MASMTSPPEEESVDTQHDHDGEPSTPTVASTFASSSPTTRTKPFGSHNALRLELPQTPQDVFTLDQNRTPGWQSPWVPHTTHSRQLRTVSNLPDIDEPNEHYASSEHDSERQMSKWALRKRAARRFILHNTLTPLVSLLFIRHYCSLEGMGLTCDLV